MTSLRVFSCCAIIASLAAVQGCSCVSATDPGLDFDGSADANSAEGGMMDGDRDDGGRDGGGGDGGTECVTEADCGAVPCTSGGTWTCSAGVCLLECTDCTDLDGDGYGMGAGCLGDDCDDSDRSSHPGGVEVCDGADNDCNLAVDDGFADLTCGVGACQVTAPACASGSPGSCTPGAPGPETCGDGIDGDCNDMIDDGCPCTGDATQPCFSGDDTLRGVGACVEGIQTCSGGAWGACIGEGMPSAETCDGVDNDCDGMDDEGLPDLTCGVGACAATATACIGGVPQTCIPGTATGETCDGVDNDCDGMVDEGNPGGGVTCGASLGGCTTQTACVGGTLLCRGTFVSPAGAPGNPGTRALPLDTIAAAQINAGIIGGGADVCICDPPAAGVTTYDEDVTMVEGTSVLGGYRCDNWGRNIATYVTRIQDLDADGLTFPPGITAVTALGGVTVGGLDVPTGSSSAITVTNSSPSLVDVAVFGGSALDAVGLRVTQTGSGTASPTITRGTYTAMGLAGGTATAVLLEASSPQILNATIGTGGGDVSGMPTTSYGIRCLDCAGTSMTNGRVDGGGAEDRAVGVYGEGDMSGVTFDGVSISGGVTRAARSTSSGVELASCTGTPTFNAVNTFGGWSPGGVGGTTHTAIEAAGAMCTPLVSGGRHVGCEVGVRCVGIACSAGAACDVDGATIMGTAGPANHIFGVRCLSGGCGSFTGNDIRAGTISSGPEGIGVEIDGASPLFDDNHIMGPNGGMFGSVAGRYYGVYLRLTTSLLTNNVIEAGSLGAPVDVVRYDQSPAGPALIEPTIHSNTMDYAACTACGARTGFAVSGPPGALIGPSGVVRNNIIRHTAAGGMTMPVRELTAQSDLRIFENNDLYDPTAPAVYVDEGVTPLSIAQVNTTIGTGNIAVSCGLNGSWHITSALSACVDAGTASGAPDQDFDPDRRPAGSGFDIGADELVP